MNGVIMQNIKSHLAEENTQLIDWYDGSNSNYFDGNSCDLDEVLDYITGEDIELSEFY